MPTGCDVEKGLGSFSRLKHCDLAKVLEGQRYGCTKRALVMVILRLMFPVRLSQASFVTCISPILLIR